MKKYFTLLLVLASLIGRASAYTFISTSTGAVPAWATMPVQFWINQSGSSQIGNGSEFEAIKSAFQTWQNVSIAKIQFQYMGTTPVSTVGQDGMNVVTFVDSSVPLGSETIATTFSFFTVDSTGSLAIQEADIAFSTTAAFSTSADPGKYDIQAVATHEVGHLLGLDHSALLSSVMTPYGVPGELDQRTLAYDDIAGVAWIYPQDSNFSTLSAISGTVTQAGTPVFGAHVVALDATGTVNASTITNSDGTYEIDFLPAGAYHLYAEPLDGPIVEKNIGGTSTSFYTGLNTNFSTTYSGNVSDLSRAATLTLVAGKPTTNGNIKVLSAGSLNLTVPSTYAVHVPQGGQTNLTVGGTGIAAGVSFSASSSALTLGPPSFGGSIGSTAPTSAQIPITVSGSAGLGPQNIAVTASGSTSVLSGAVVVVNPQPSNIGVAPTSGTIDGGTGVSITGQNFRSGAQVYFGGLPASNVQVVNSTSIQATAPANAAGAENVVVVNVDGTWGVQTNAFTYTAQPPQVNNISPLNGPPGTIVTITGAEFGSRISGIDLRFNGTPANIISASRTTLTASVPFGATTGPV
ncbi:MAG TPA: IPT/TIG domain-containing protein, partial [Terriglobia bacterium]|nr:IPT/TIG domain-containing protein [Terriglobia bacterium]